MNIAVVNLRDIIKYAICFIIVIAIILIGISALKKEELDKEAKKTSTSFFENIKNSSFLYCINIEFPLISSNNVKNKEEKNIYCASNKVLSSELPLIYSLEEYSENEKIELAEQTQEISKQEEIQEEKTEIAEKLPTEVISDNNIKEKYTNEGRNVKVNNQTNFDINDIINNSNYEVKNKEKVIIYHTHTCESYTSSDAYSYSMTGNYRTTDLNYTVSRVGDELEKYLKEYGKTVIHDKTYHDYPEYNGSYSNSLKTMNKVLENNQDAEITIDLHRDAVRKY